MELSKWNELQGLIDEAMINQEAILHTPEIGSECVVRDVSYDSNDTGFRRAKVIDLSKLPRLSVELVDSSKKVALKQHRVYESPSILTSLEKSAQTAMIHSLAINGIDLKEGGRYRAIIGKCFNKIFRLNFDST